MQKKKWTLLEAADQGGVLALADSLNISAILAELLYQRNITNFFEAKKFFRPVLENLHDPYLMEDMEKAAVRTISAITSNEKIVVFGDYDVDGTCSAALMYMVLKELGANVDVFIPNRLNDGYGISKASVKTLFDEQNLKLLISVDCGITAVEEVEYANSLGIETIICDHHQPKEELPKAYAILDPIQPNCNYPFKYLSGAGVGFKLCRAVCDRIGQSEMVLKHLDLVALAGAADIVPLVDENRILVKAGINAINNNPRPGIKALLKVSKMEPGNLGAGKIVFSVAPRINAVGRMGDAMRAVQLFVEEDPQKAAQFASVLESENIQRRKIDEMTFSHAIELFNETVDLEKDKAIVLHDDNWHPGVIGIVASRMVERFHRPAIMLSTSDGLAKGSARSIPGFNIYEALEECEDMLVQFGGHKAAAGLAIEIDKIPEFRKRFNEVLSEKLTEEDLVQEIKVNVKISLSEITPKFCRILDEFAPFGPGNMRPVFMAEDVELVTQPRIVGTNHIVTTLKQADSDKVFDSIGFNLGHYISVLDKNENMMDIVFTIEQISRDGRVYPQLRLKDIHVKDKLRSM